MRQTTALKATLTGLLLATGALAATTAGAASAASFEPVQAVSPAGLGDEGATDAARPQGFFPGNNPPVHCSVSFWFYCPPTR